MVEIEDYRYFVDAALDEMAAILGDLGDELANRKPDLVGANSPVQILTHCLGVMAGWIGGFAAGRTIVRDRDAEFAAVSSVADLLAQMAESRAAFVEDLASIEPSAPPRLAVPPPNGALPIGATQGGICLHVYQELVQHLGQLELTRDLLRAE